MTAVRCDIFCNVVDNYGDIGVSWRLARQLVHEYAVDVRLWVDDLSSFAKLCPEIDADLMRQSVSGVIVCQWQQRFPDVQPADWVIEMFGCTLPENYIAAMAKRQPAPVWINLEYLSAEGWVQGCHRLPSPHPRFPLTKYFFFPGFTQETGGLLLEHDLLSVRDAFQADLVEQQNFWQSIGIEKPADNVLKVSLFSYENIALDGLFDTWASGTQSVLCLIPEGRILSQVGRYFDGVTPLVGSSYILSNLQVKVIPFMSQSNYDRLLWACDVNFVRGEDSCVRAQWAGKPFVWQIYPQHDAVHWMKLDAFLDLYCASLSLDAAQVVRNLWQGWNEQRSSDGAWGEFAISDNELNQHAKRWAEKLSENNLALNLLDFCREVGKI